MRMERLTIPDVRVDKNTIKRSIIDARKVKELAMEIYWRLKAIEDVIADEESEEYDLDRIRELAQADRDGRCMVLRFKPDTPVYRLWRKTKTQKANITYHYLKSIYDCFEAESWLNAYDSIEAAMADLKKLEEKENNG